MVAGILLEQEVPQSMEDGDVSERCDPTQNKWPNKPGRGSCAMWVSKGWEMVTPSPVCSFILSVLQSPELQEWCPGGEQMVEIPKRGIYLR